MAYNPNNAEQIKRIPPGEVVEGVVIEVEDGTARKFIHNELAISKYKNPDEPHINVVVEFKYDDRTFRIDQMFSYIVGSTGKVLYTDKSNMGKFFKFYNTLPTVGVKVKVISNAEGYFKMMF